ncbi:MAG: hypothetical protein KF788_08655 [Piscinibacter sp.]|nr:hypothetical protein [Piscinibacter sp.]
MSHLPVDIHRRLDEPADTSVTPPPAPWRPMKTAPNDGTAVLLLIVDGEHPLQDENPSVSIGSFGVEGGPESDPTWHFAGWSWHHDCYCRGAGEPRGWLPLPSTAAATVDATK